jgi:hypothetical protein
MNSGDSDRLDAIARLAVEYVRQMIERDGFGPRADLAIAQIDSSPVRLSLDVMSDQAAAQQLASAIYRALAKEVER